MGRLVGVVVLVPTVLGGLSACESTPELGILTPYGAGYSDGCDSGYADYGLDYFDYENSGGVFWGGDYGAGWDKGYDDCLAFIRAAAL